VLDGGGIWQNSGVVDDRTAHCAWAPRPNGTTMTTGFCQQISPPAINMPRPNFRKISAAEDPTRLVTPSCFYINRAGNFFSKVGHEFAGKEAQEIGIAVCTAYTEDAANCTKYVTSGASIVNALTRSAGSDRHGVIRATPGHTICRASFVSNDWSVTSATTFNATIQRTRELNGLVWYVAMPDRGQTGDWIDTMIVLDEVPIGTEGKAGCWQLTYKDAGTPLDGETRTHVRAWECKGDSCLVLHPGAKISLPEGLPKCTARH
jgi:hypothetical protein